MTTSADPSPLNCSWLDRISLTVKMVVITVGVGLSLWAFMNYVQSTKLKNIFYVQLIEELTEQSIQWRLKLDRYIRSYSESAELITAQQKFVDHIKKQNWQAEETVQAKYFGPASPPWFPTNSLLRLLTRPRYALLLDPAGKVREVYSRHETPPPPALLQMTHLMFLKSRNQSFITQISDTLHVIASHSYTDEQGKVMATLILTSPIDEEFLVTSIGSIPSGYLIALASIGKDPKILISSNQNELPQGTPVRTLEDRFLITGEQTYNYGAAEYIIKLVSFVSVSEADRMTEKVIATGKQQRNIIAPALILTFALIMFIITQRIDHLNFRMSNFLQESLGAKKQDLSGGDQIYLLNRRFEHLTRAVMEAREMIKQEADEKTQLIVKNAFDAIVTIDAENVIRTWNPQAEKIFGWTRNEAVGQKAAHIIMPDRYREQQETALRSYLSGDSDILNKQIEFPALHRDGHEFPVELTVSRVKSEDSYLFIAIIRDVTERKKAEEALKASHERLVTVLDSLDAIVYVADMKTHELLFINRYTRSMFGNIEGKVCWESLQENQTGPCAFCTNDRLLDPYDDIAEIYTWEFQNTINGNWYYIQDRAIKWIDNRTVRLEIATDITKLKLVEEKIKASLREKDVLLREIHHRVKNNMQIISSLINLQAQYVSDEHYLEMFVESRNRIRSMALVHEKLYRSKDLTNINFSDYISSLANELFTSFNMHRHVRLETSLEDISMPIDIAIPCGLIINELLTNSFKHAFPDGRKGIVEITFTSQNRQENSYNLTVKDNGIGIPEHIDIRSIKSLGFQLITNLAEHQLRGTIQLSRSEGTLFQINFKSSNYKNRI